VHAFAEGGQGIPAGFFGIAPALNTPLQLGYLVRLGYLVFDIDDNEISLLQTNCDANGTELAEITTGNGSVPNSTPVANAVSVTQGTGAFTSSTPTGHSSKWVGRE